MEDYEIMDIGDKYVELDEVDNNIKTMLEAWGFDFKGTGDVGPVFEIEDEERFKSVYNDWLDEQKLR